MHIYDAHIWFDSMHCRIVITHIWHTYMTHIYDSRIWLHTYDSRIWLHTYDSRIWLHAYDARIWLHAYDARIWLYAYDARIWLHTYDAHIWCTYMIACIWCTYMMHIYVLNLCIIYVSRIWFSSMTILGHICAHMSVFCRHMICTYMILNTYMTIIYVHSHIWCTYMIRFPLEMKN